MTSTLTPDLVATRVREVADGYARGWAFLPLKGKGPVQKGWSKRPRPTRDECEQWARQGNVGLRTGPISGVVVVDLDEGSSTVDLELPTTVTVITGSGGRHLYYRVPDAKIGNSSGRLGDHIDVRGEGGQVVFVGSVHPKTGLPYCWAEACSPSEVEVAQLPQSIIERLASPSRNGSSGNGCTPYGLAALERELDLLRRTPEGSRNTELNRAAFVLGQLIAGGELDGQRVQNELLAATTLGAEEAARTVASGLRAGLREPRSAPDSLPAESVKSTHRSTVLVPGAHLDDKGNYCEVGEGDFARRVLSHVPEERIYLRGEPAVAGEICGERGGRYFKPLSPDGIRLVMGDHTRLVKWAKLGQSDLQVQKVCTATRPLAGLVLEEAPNSNRLRRLDLIVPFPAHGCEPGWNPNGVFYDQAEGLEGLKPETNREIIDNALEDLLIDFPFKNEASRQNYIGLLITLLMRPALDGNVPLHLMLSPLERTGKTKLVEEVLGGVLLGHPTPALQLNGTDEEIDKRLVGLLLKAKPVVHLDNLRAYIDSGALASLLTAACYQGRMLGSNAMPELKNRTVLVASGNNVRMSSEMAKRTVPIVLQPSDDAPELREDFHHPDLRAHVRENRRLVLECLLGMIANWELAGKPGGAARLGGFETWARVTGGVMATQGFDQWLANLREWQREADPHGEDLSTFVEAWHAKYQTGLVLPNALMDVAIENEVFLGEVRGTTERGKLNSFSKRVLGRHKDTPVGAFIIRQDRNRQSRFWRLEHVQGGLR